MFDFHALTARLDGASSERIVLRRLAYADAWPLFDATRVPLFNEHLLWTRPHDPTAVLPRVQAIVDSAACGELTAVSAMHKDTGAWVGVFRFLPPTTAVAQGLEMGIWMHPRFWVGQYSHELACLCIGGAFSVPGVERLVASATLTNRSSWRLMEGVGMVRMGRSLRPTEAGQDLAMQDFIIERAQWNPDVLHNPRVSVRRAAARGQQRDLSPG